MYVKENKYNTKQREIILNYIKENSEKYISADDILKYINKNKSIVGLTTVYRYLNILVENGLVRKDYFEDLGKYFYQYVGKDNDCDSHSHLKCNNCGKLIHLKCSHIDNVSKHLLEEHGFSINNSKTVLYGTCEKCAK